MARPIFEPNYQVRRKRDENNELYYVVEFKDGKRSRVIFKMDKGDYQLIEYNPMSYRTLRDAIIAVVNK